MRSSRTDNRIKRHSLRARIASLLAVVVILFSLVVPVIHVHAVGENASLTITVAERQDGLPGAPTPIPDVRVKIYQVARVELDTEPWQYTMAPNFAGSGVTVEQMTGSASGAHIAATTLYAYTLTSTVSEDDSLTSDFTGTVTFTIPADKLGVYLVVPESITVGDVRYEFDPYLIQVPTKDQDTGEPIYHANALIKNGSSTNLEPQTVRVIARFSGDNGVGRPSSVTAVLYRNGSYYDSKILSEANGWQCEWTNLRASYNWAAAGQSVSGYTLTVSKQGIVTYLTYTYEAPPPAPPNSSYSTASTNTLPGDTIPGATVPMMAGIGTLVAAVGAAKFLF